ncbi:SDR family NAD(P)-dependent oxidoreductase [Sulfitobacter pseudonitzschiae]|uniref:SDR family NAD(P)-dependent oxidoreductase n=1 Tax=Pseudosulfitobacter pseudonitzschiae TaxID=1402135 RepID=A0A9Q2NEK9_9RHOB|nr:SDR family NAD(P)-dependent oxidoreductase [Pseudosulfitobacter pseudonitzschiae]MBM2290316.1 SDR family NAD(P)-dependent oxidoreductase [Pseudosulfitobacter pseudonitzschiae]MBM2295234.1 SDR family NAD(P)-dependent oxidoreductase [Pseudosulfitobacter pseudonitzschiae]MBM2300146.1 SDR family NAD(P)-dependent oxidoreductase [Pseudosulfitobacter pseudonitzschiae]MBM2309931.1 SDR family NAD(P)-dependent oxidoreductase [Pseudosulfitobacter pseudonitzschiae]MBM2314843.1 SDR family NAD(P)-depende
MNWQGKRYWLVGASDGLGAALARKLSARGVEVVLSARSEDKLRALADELPGKASIQTVDIADHDSVKEAAKAVGRIDGLVLLAGVYWPFGAREWDADQAVAMADINFTGFMRVLGQVVPDFVARDAGHIVITSSLTGFRGLPGSIGYTASKAATMSLAECMHADLRKTGVLVQVCNPGFIKTQLTDKNDFKMPMIMQPEEAAQHMVEHMETDQFKTSFPWLFSLVFRGANFLPDWLYYRIFS